MIHNDDKFEKKLEDLLDSITSYPKAILNPETRSHDALSARQPEKALSSIQETVEDMRICIKYLLFDLDATRRENRYYKKLLDDKES